MNLHPNARTTPVTRQLLVHRIEHEGWEVALAADATGISVRTAYKWLRRWRLEGQTGLQDRSSAPRSIPNRTAKPFVRRIEKLRRQGLAAFQIAAILDMARSTVSAVLVRLGLNRLKALEPKEPANRYERARPGELVHLDVKKLGRVRGVGKRIHGTEASELAGSAGSTSMSVWTTTAGWPTSRSWTMNEPKQRPASWSEPSPGLPRWECAWSAR